MPTRVISDIIAGRPVVTGASDMTVRAACKLMADKRIGALLVVDGNRISGIFTERDALNKVLAGSLDPESTTLAQVMVHRCSWEGSTVVAVHNFAAEPVSG